MAKLDVKYISCCTNIVQKVCLEIKGERQAEVVSHNVKMNPLHEIKWKVLVWF